MENQSYHINSYDKEQQKDKLLNTIKMLCFMYLENPKNIEQVETTRLESYFNYCIEEYQTINDLKDSLKVKVFHRPYEEIYSNLDDMITSGHLLSKRSKISFIELTKDINNLSDTLAFCFGLISKIIQERDIN